MPFLSSKRRRRPQYRPLVLEQLESRQLLTASPSGLGLVNEWSDFEPLAVSGVGGQAASGLEMQLRSSADFGPSQPWIDRTSGNSQDEFFTLAAAEGEGEASDPGLSVIIDTGGPGYSEVGQGWMRYTRAGDGQDQATWQHAVEVGTYIVQATWHGWDQHVNDAPYRIYDGDTLLTEVRVDQQRSPTGITIGDATFETLAEVDITSGMLRVVLANDASGGQYVVADRVRIERVRPVAVDDHFEALSNAALTVPAPGVLANDVAPSVRTLSASLSSHPQHGTVTMNADGSFSYSPPAGFTGTDSFTYRAYDNTSASNEATVTLTVENPNQPPVAHDQLISTDQNTPVPIALTGSDPEGDTLIFEIITQPAYGTLTRTTPDLIYTPNTDYVGHDNFTFQVNDGQLTSDIATVAITVNQIKAPVAEDDAYSTPRNTALTVDAPGVLANDSDPYGGALQAVICTPPANGQLMLSADGSFTYVPAVNFVGEDSFTYRAQGSRTLSDIATVQLHVEATNRAPVADDQAVVTDQNIPLPITLYGSDPDGDPLTYTIFDGPTYGTLTGTPPDLTYTPAHDYRGEDTFTFQVDDGMLTSVIATVAITINAGNNAPVAVNDAYSTSANTPLVVAAPGILAHATDPDGDPLTAVWVSDPTNGTLELNPDGSFTYQPNPGFTGSDSFLYQAHDGELDSHVATVLITVRPAFVTPWFEDSFEGAPPYGWRPDWGHGSTRADHDTTDVAGTPPGGGDYSYRQWFRDPSRLRPTVDFVTNTFRLENHGYANGTSVRFNIDPGGVLPGGLSSSHWYEVLNATDDTFQVRWVPYSHVQNITTNGTGPWYVFRSVSTGALGLEFGEGKQVPQTIKEGEDISISYWLKYHPDFEHGSPSGSKHWMMASTDNPNVDRVDHHITGNNGRMQISFQAVHGNYDANVNGIPAGDQNYYMPVGEWVKFDWYIKVSPDTAEGRQGILKGWVNNELRWDYSEIATIRSGAYESFLYWAQFASGPPRGENQERYLDSFRIGPGAMVLNEQNIRPPVAYDQSLATDQKTPVLITLTGSNLNGDVLAYEIVTQPAHGTLTGTAPDLIYTPSTGDAGQDSFTFRVHDGLLSSDIATVAITVHRINHAPLAVDDAYSTPANTPLIVAAPGILANATDPDGDPLTAVWVSDPTNGRLELNPDGSFTYQPNPGFTGSDSFLYQANDGELDSNVATVVITVRPEFVEPWFADSFEGPPPHGWRAEWGYGSKGADHNTTDAAGTPPGGGNYSYRQWFQEPTPQLYPTVDFVTNTFVLKNHGYANGTSVRFNIDPGGVLPGGLSSSHWYEVLNATDDTFQVRWVPYSNVHNITSTGTGPWYVFETISTGALGLEFGAGKQVPQTIGEGQDISISYWLKYHPDFDHGSPTGSKHWMMASTENSSVDRVYHNIIGDNGRMRILFQAVHGNHYANVNGIPGGDQNYYMPVGEWVKFDWYIKVSPDTEGGRQGVLKGWVNNELRWDYSEIATIRSGAYQSFLYWAQFASGPPRGENQERYLDSFRIGPGAMVLREQEAFAAGRNEGSAEGESSPLSLSGLAFLDTDGDGTQQAHASPPAEMIISLTGTDSQGNEIQQGTAENNGTYRLPSLDHGTYKIAWSSPTQGSAVKLVDIHGKELFSGILEEEQTLLEVLLWI